MIKKLLHRITVVWCLYGLIRLCIFANPWVFRIAKMYRPLFYKSRASDNFNESWDIADPYQIIFVWFWVAVALGLVLAACAVIHIFSDWFFNTQKKD